MLSVLLACFYTRLAVSKWIAPRLFLMDGVLGYNITGNSIVQSSPLLAMTWDWHSQCLQKQLGVLGYNITDNSNAIVLVFISVS